MDCARCSAPIVGRRSDAKYCSPHCQERASKETPEARAKIRERVRLWVKNNPDRTASRRRDYSGRPFSDAMLEKRYGITRAEYNAMLEEQEGGCAICREAPGPSEPYGLHVDHDHATKQVRGLLCATCNRRIVFFEGRREWTYWALAYLDWAMDHPR